MSLTAIRSLESARIKFSWSRRTSCLQSRNQLFLGSGCQNESNSHQIARIGEKKIFHELDVHHVYKVGITCFWAQDAKMSLTAIRSLESARREFSWTRRTSCLQSRNHLFLGSGFQNDSNSHQLARIGEKKIFHELDVHHVYKVGITCFWSQDAKMSLTAIRSLESARRKFSWTRRTSCLQSRNHLFLGSGFQIDSNSHQLARIGEKKIFHELDVHHVYKVGITCFLSQDAKMSLTASSSLECEQKILHELDVHHVYKVGITSFWAQDAKMSLTAISSLESARRKFSWTPRTSYLQSSNHYFLGYGCQNESNSQYPERIGEKKIFHELDVHHVYKVGITCFWAQDSKLTLTAISSLESRRRKFFMNSTYIMSTK